MWLERIAIFGVPIAAVLLTVLLLLGPGRERTVIGVRAHGLLTPTSQELALRVRTVAHSGKRFRPIGREQLSLSVEHAGKTLGRWRGPTRPHGNAEVRISLTSPLPSGATIRVAIDDQAIATSSLRRKAVLATRPAETTNTPAIGSIGIHVPRRRALASFPEQLIISARIAAKPDDGEGNWPNLVLTATGAEVDKPERHGSAECSTASCLFHWTTHFTPRAPTACAAMSQLDHSGPSLQHSAPLPIAGGGWWLLPGAETSRRATLRASGPREHVWVSLYGRDGRHWGARVKTRIDRSGFSEAKVNLPPIPSGPFRLVASSDFIENPSTSWLLRPDLGQLDEAKLGLVFDTLPPKVKLEERRSQGARWPVFGLVLSAGLFELLYILYRARRSRARLRAHFETAKATGPQHALLTRPPLYWLVLASATLLAAFAALATLSLVVGR